MQQLLKKIPDRLTIALLSLLLVASIASIWAQFHSQEASHWVKPLGGLVFILVLALIYVAGWRAYAYHQKMSELLEGVQEDRKYLQQQVALGNSDLEKQKAMLLAFQQSGYQSRIVSLAADFMNVTHAAFLQLDPHGEVIECIQSSIKEKHPLIKGVQWKKNDYPKFFQLIEEGQTIVYPDHLSVHRGYRSPLGNLLYYIENNHVKSLLVMPTGVVNGTTGVVWFEDRATVRKWDERAIRQAEFISGIVHLDLMQELQQGMIKELSTGMNRMETLREYTSQGWAWYQLPSMGRVQQASLQIDRLKGANPIEQNPQFIALMPKMYAYASLEEWWTEELFQQFVSQNYTFSNHEWEHEDSYFSVSAFGVSNAGMLQGLWVAVVDITQERHQAIMQEKVMGNFSNIITEIDIDNKIVFDSPSIARLDFETTHRVGGALPSFLHHEDMEKFELALWKARREQIAVTSPYLRLRKHFGGYVHFDAKIKPASTEGGLIIEFIEATARAAEQERMQASQDFLTRLLAHSHELVAVINTKDQLTYISENIENLFGYAKGDRLGRYALEYFHRQDTPVLIKALERLQEGDIRQYAQEARFLHRNGKWRKVQVAMHAMYQEGQVSAIALRIEDISEERKDIELLRNREQLFSTFMDRSSRSFWLLSAKGQVRYVTHNAQKLLGFQQKELLGKSLLPLISQQDAQAFERNLTDWSADSSVRSTIFVGVKHKDGSLKSLAMSYLGSVKDEQYEGLLLSVEEPLTKQIVESQIDLRADFFQALANTLPMPTFFIDKAHEVKFANTASRDWLGFTPSGAIESLLDAKSIRSLTSLKEEQASVLLRIKDKKGQFWQTHAQVISLRGSVVKGQLLLVLPQTEEAKVLEEQLQQARVKIQQVEQEKQSLILQQEQHRKAIKALEEELSTIVKSHESEVEYLNDRLDLVQGSLVSKNAAIVSLETKLQMLEELKERGKVLQQHFEGLRELLYMFDDIGQEVDWQAKWQEIANFKQLINYEQALKETRRFIVDTQELLSNVTSNSTTY